MDCLVIKDSQSRLTVMILASSISLLLVHLVVAFKNWHGETRRFVDSSSGDIAFIMSWLSFGHCRAVVVIPIDLRRTPNGWRRWAGLCWARVWAHCNFLMCAEWGGGLVSGSILTTAHTHRRHCHQHTQAWSGPSSIQRNIVVMHVF